MAQLVKTDNPDPNDHGVTSEGLIALSDAEIKALQSGDALIVGPTDLPIQRPRWTFTIKRKAP